MERSEEGPPSLPPDDWERELRQEGPLTPNPKPFQPGETFDTRKEGTLARLFLCPHPGCEGRQPIRYGHKEDASGKPITECRCNKNTQHHWAILWDSEEKITGRVIIDHDAPMFEFPDER